MIQKYEENTGILLYSQTNITYYNQSNPAQWFNHSLTHNITYYSNGYSPSSNDDDNNNDDNDGVEILLTIEIILLTLAISAISIIICIIILRHRKVVKVDKPLKHNPKIKKN